MNGHLIDICEIGALKEILVNDIGVPEIGENGRIEIDGKMYQWVGAKTPSEQLRGVNGWVAKKTIDKQSNEWKEKNTTFVKSKGGNIVVCKIDFLQKILISKIWLNQLGENGKVEIDGKMYQRVGSNTPSEQLRGVNGWVAKKTIDKQSNEWKEKNSTAVQSKGGMVNVYELSILKELLKHHIGLQKIGENGKVEIDGKMYQRVGPNTPSEQLRGIEGTTAVKIITEKGDKLWLSQNMSEANSRTHTIKVYEINALKELLKNDAGLPTLGKDGRVEISGKLYQHVGDNTPSIQLFGINSRTVKNRLKVQPSDWIEHNTSIVKKNISGKKILVYELEALKNLLKNDAGLPTLGKNGKVEIDGKMYQRVGQNTLSEQLWGMRPHAVIYRLKKQSGNWNIKYMKKAKSKGGIAFVYEINALKELLGIID